MIITGLTIFDLLSNNQFEKNVILFSIIFSGIIILPLQFLHKIIHALLFTHEGVKEIYVSKDLLSCVVYCTKLVSKIRFIIIVITPNILLGCIAIFTAVLFREVLDVVFVMILTIIGVALIAARIGDYCNI